MTVRRLLPAAFALLAPLCVAVPASAAEAPVTSVTMVSDTGDYIGGGRDRLFTPENGTVSLTGSPSRVSVDVSGGSSGSFTLNIAAPPNQVLQRGEYDGGLDISGDGRGCSRVEGRFTVLDIATTGDTVDRLHVLYEQHCGGNVAALFGEIRYQVPGGDTDLLVAPGNVAWPVTHPGVGARPVPVTFHNTGGRPIAFGQPAIDGDADSFSVISNTCTSTVVADESCVIYVRFTPAAPGPHTAVLTVPDDTQAGARRIALAGVGESGTTSWRMRSEPGDYIGAGRSYDWTPANAVISARGSEAYVIVGVEASDGYYTAEFAPGRNDVLLPGRTYEGARRYPFHDPDPGLTVFGSGRGCNQSIGRFTVHDIAFGDKGLERLSVTFEQHCEGAEPALLGSIAFRADRPAEPVPGSPESRFSDIAGTPHEDNIVAVAERRIAGGFSDGTYRPLLAVTRGQMATFLSRALDLPGAEPAGFTDTSRSVHREAIDAVAAAGIADGYGDGSFRPDEPVTRGQMATFLSRGFDLPPASSAGFRDTAGDPHEKAIDSVAAAGITSGFGDGTYRPRDAVARGQMATFLARALGIAA